jgi:GTPase SAR1 family protein
LAKTIDELITRTHNLEKSMPQLTGAFADFSAIRSGFSQAQGRKATVVVGTIKAGKTTLVNALVGHDLLPRGSGVKSLILTTISDDPRNEYEIQLRSLEGIANTMQHDFRILGTDFSARATNCGDLVNWTEDEYQRLLRSMKQDGRFNLETGLDSNQTIIHTAFVRIEKTLAGLKKLTAEFDKETLKHLENYCPIVKKISESEYFSRVANSVDLASITELIKLRVPFMGRLDRAVQIIDCQGSDSLNPLDISSVRSAFYSADRILYVINSRLGLRQGDRDLLRTIRNSRMSCPVLL